MFLWTEVEQFYLAFMSPSKSDAAISNLCAPAVDRWKRRYKEAQAKLTEAKDIFDRTLKSKDTVLITNAETSMKDCRKELEALLMFKKDLGTFSRFYEFMSQIINYDRHELDQLSLFARHLQPMLKVDIDDDDPINLDDVVLTHYRLSKIRERNLVLAEDSAGYDLTPGEDIGAGKSRDKQEDFLSRLLERLNELFDDEELTDNDRLSYAQTILGKIQENEKVMDQFRNNSREQAMLGDFPAAFEAAVMDCSDAHNKQMLMVLSDSRISDGFKRAIYDLWLESEAG